MEHLQRQQEAKLEMNLQEKQLLQAQLLFAQHAAAARASGSKLDSALFSKADGQPYSVAPPALNSHLSRMEPDEEDEDSDEEEPEDQADAEEDEEENSLHQHAKKPRLHQVAGLNLSPYSSSQLSAGKQMADSPPPATKQEHEEKEVQSPAGQQAFTSPNGFADWGYDDTFKQVSCDLTSQI